MTTWTPKTQQAETWTDEARVIVFDPNVFDRLPIFDTGGNLWTQSDQQSEIWTPIS